MITHSFRVQYSSWIPHRLEFDLFDFPESALVIWVQLQRENIGSSALPRGLLFIFSPLTVRWYYSGRSYDRSRFL